jgi:hypothetical protein
VSLCNILPYTLTLKLLLFAEKQGKRHDNEIIALTLVMKRSSNLNETLNTIAPFAIKYHTTKLTGSC